MSIYVTGDIHLNHDSAKLNSTFFPEGKILTKNDYVIICGDFGFIWNCVAACKASESSAS